MFKYKTSLLIVVPFQKKKREVIKKKKGEVLASTVNWPIMEDGNVDMGLSIYSKKWLIS
jgi:hypothetical protein